MVIFLIFTFCIDLIFAMDGNSVVSDSSNIESIDWTENPKHEVRYFLSSSLTLNNLNSNVEADTDDQTNFAKDNEPNQKSGKENVSKVSEENFNESGNEINENKLKRKHQPDELCEYCSRKGKRSLVNSKLSNIALCGACYAYERQHGKLEPRNERKKRGKHKKHILVCEFCQQESTQFLTGKVSGKSLCRPCYAYEKKHRYLVPLDERDIRYPRYPTKRQSHGHILACEGCQNESTKYIKSKLSDKSLCPACYSYENLYGHLNKLKYNPTIRVCEYEFCHRDTTKYKRGKFSGQALCKECYNYEYRHGHLVPLDERKYYTKK